MSWATSRKIKNELAGEPPALLVEIGAAHEVVAAGAAEFALLVVQFVAALRAPAPVFAGGIFAADGTSGGRWSRI